MKDWLRRIMERTAVVLKSYDDAVALVVNVVAKHSSQTDCTSN